ncbi:hypothetical protein [Tsuneonella suprasediminis]|uniref:hypothetical protein n=1 Tax=Tsuneonella suprasediminis TaxID=2306996 RepID=UPI002F95CB86
MRRLREATARGFESVSRAIRQQPDYSTEISDAYFDALEKRIEEEKPKDFTLTPISDAGW